MSALRLAVILEAVDRLTRPAREITTRVRRLAERTGLDRIAAQARAVGGQLGTLARHAGAMAAKIGAAFGIAAGGGLLVMTKSIADTGDAAAKASQRIGIGVESYQRLGYAAGLAGSSQEGLTQGLNKLNRSVILAGRGNKQAEANFRRLGISLKDSNGKAKTTEQVFGELADRFAKMPDGAAKSTMALQLFGGAGEDLIPLLNGGAAAMRAAGAEAEALGLIMSKDAAADSEEFNDNLSRLQGAIRGIWIAIATRLIPIISPMIAQMTRWVAANRELIATRVEEFLTALPPILTTIRDVLSAVWQRVQPVLSAFATLADWIGPANVALGLLAITIGTKLVAAFGPLTVAVAKLGLVLMATPIGWFLAAVAALAGIVYVIWRNWTPIAGFFRALWDRVAGAFDGFLGWVRSGFQAGVQAVLDAILAIWRPLDSFFGGLWTGIQAVFGGFLSWLGAGFRTGLQGMLDMVVLVWRPLSAFYSGLWTGIQAVFGGFLSWLGAGFNGGLQAILDAVLLIWRPISAFFDGVWTGVKETFSGFLAWLDGAFAGGLRLVLDGIWGIVGPVIERISSAIGGVMGLAGKVTGIGDAIGGAWKKVTGQAEPAPQRESAKPGLWQRAFGERGGPAPAQAEVGGEIRVVVEDGRTRIGQLRSDNDDVAITGIASGRAMAW